MMIALMCAFCIIGAVANAQQTDNHLLSAVPPPGKVVIDGKLDDWDLSGQIEVFANFKTKNSYSAKVAAMYDQDNFYLSVEWRDPTPMHNMIDSNFDIGFGWRSDCLQLRLKTDMIVGDVSCWYSTAADHPVINIAYGRFSGGKDADDVDKFNSLNDALKSGAQEAFKKGDDGKSYVQEIALPWKLITGQGAIVKATGKPFKEPMSFKAGDTFSMGMEFLWGPADGRTFPIHRYADLLKEGTSSREFFWTAVDSWGPVRLEPKGNLKREKVEIAASAAYLQKTGGPVTLKYEMPFDGFATIVIEDENGKRVRNLVGMAPRSKGTQTDFWDGTDDQGKFAPLGKYRWRGLLHQGIDPVYEASYGTPGNPPWDNVDNTGAWMSDHCAPNAVAAGTGLMALAAPGSEGGWALIATDMDGKKLWGERKFQGIRDLAVDGDYILAGMNDRYWEKDPPPPTVGRAEFKTGKYAPFECKPNPELIVPVATKDEKASLVGMAISGDQLAVALGGLNVIRFFNKKTMEKVGQINISDVQDVAADAKGVLYAISGKTVVKKDGDQWKPVISAGLEKPFSLAIGQDGRMFVSEKASNQILVFDAAGKAAGAIGVKGGRPVPGKWEPNGMRNPAGIAVDAQGRIWVAEDDMFPKRVSVWTSDPSTGSGQAGKLVRDFIGPTTYGGMGAAVDSTNKTRVFGNGCEFKLDYDKNQTTVVASLVNDNLVGELLKIDGREYFMNKKGTLFIRRGDTLVLVASVGVGVGKPDQDVPELVSLGLGGVAKFDKQSYVSWVWSDVNDDGKGQPDEVTIIPGASLGGGYWGGYWLDEDFNIWAAPGGYGPQEVSRIPLKGWSKGGVPIWDLAAKKNLGTRESPGPNKLYLAMKDGAVVGTPLTGLAADGSVRWTYSKDGWGDVHGSHLAPIPDRDDLLIGTISCIGRADTKGKLGKIFAMNSNMGRLYIMTTDGLLVASVFQDCRTGCDGWPNDVKKGAPMGGVTMGGEWFGGYFFKAEATSEYYLIAGGTSYNLIKLNGLDTLAPIAGGSFEFTGKDLLAAETLQKERAAAAAAANVLAIARLEKTPELDGKIEKYPKDSFVEWISGGYKTKALVGTDGTNLCLVYDVNGDANPMVNGGQDWTQLFITGDSVDLQLGTNAGADPKRVNPEPGDERILISVIDNKPVAVLYRWKVKDGDKHPVKFTCPWRDHTVDDVRKLDDAKINIVRSGSHYMVEALIPLKSLGFDPQAGKEYKLDLGVIFSDAKGNDRAARVYWSNKATGLVNDVPGEIMGSPNLWGRASLK